MTAEQYFDMTPDEEAAFDRADQRGDSNAYIARIALGISVPSEVSKTSDAQEKTQLPGKPISYNKPSGHVQDFSGRSDEHRGGMIPPQTPEAMDSYHEALPELIELHDDLIKSELLNKIADGTLTPAGAQARWVAYLEKHNR